MLYSTMCLEAIRTNFKKQSWAIIMNAFGEEVYKILQHIFVAVLERCQNLLKLSELNICFLTKGHLPKFFVFFSQALIYDYDSPGTYYGTNGTNCDSPGTNYGTNGTNCDSPVNLQFKAGYVFYIFGEIKVLRKHLKFHNFRKNTFFYPQTSNFLTKIGVFILFHQLNNNSPKQNLQVCKGYFSQNFSQNNYFFHFFQ